MKYLKQKHQGVIAFVSAHNYVDLEDILKLLKKRRRTFLIILDSIKDPHNLGQS